MSNKIKLFYNSFLQILPKLRKSSSVFLRCKHSSSCKNASIIHQFNSQHDTCFGYSAACNRAMLQSDAETASISSVMSFALAGFVQMCWTYTNRLNKSHRGTKVAKEKIKNNRKWGFEKNVKCRNNENITIKLRLMRMALRLFSKNLSELRHLSSEKGDNYI